MKNNDKFNRFMGEHPRTITKHISNPRFYSFTNAIIRCSKANLGNTHV